MSLPRQYRHMQDEITIRRACSLMSPHDVDTALAAACVARICGKDGGEVYSEGLGLGATSNSKAAPCMFMSEVEAESVMSACVPSYIKDPKHRWGYLLGHYYHKVEAYMKHHLAAQIAESQAPAATVPMQEATSDDISQAPVIARQQLTAWTPSSRVKAFARLALAACSPGRQQLPGNNADRRSSSTDIVTNSDEAADDTAEAVCVSSASWSPLTRISSIGR